MKVDMKNGKTGGLSGPLSSRFLGRETSKDFIKLFLEGFCFFQRHRKPSLHELAAHLFRHGKGLFLEVGAFFRQQNNIDPFIQLAARTSNIAQTFQGLKNGREGSRIKIKPGSQVFYGYFSLLSENHHGNVLRIGQANLFQIRVVGCYNLTRTGVERETKLTIEQQPLVLVIFHGTSPLAESEVPEGDDSILTDSR